MLKLKVRIIGRREMSTPHCFENPPTLNPSCGKGSVEVFEGLHTYITGPRDSKKAILLISDAFGYEAPNLRKLADKYADEGYLVLAPDFFYGDPALLGIVPNFDIPKWRAAHTAEKGAEDALAIITALKNKGVSAVGAVGFCWGGEVVVRLAKHEIIQAGVVLHPGPLKVEHINEVKIPIALLGAEIDEYCPAEDIVQFGKILSAKPEVESYTKIFPGVNHGWALRYDTNDEFAVKSSEEALADTRNWLNKYIK